MSLREKYCREHGLTELPRRSLYRLLGKRLFDLAVCVPICIVALPVFLLTAIVVRLDSRGPVFFVQARLGRYGSTFRTWKFRSMTHRERSAHAEILPGHSEVTRIGRWLRRSKIDELPQLLNILKGDMSLVGPRPALPAHIRDYDENGLHRLLERPGLTGLAQVNGNIYLSWPERWVYDAEYVDSLSVSLDATIAAKTVAVVFWGEERFLNRPETENIETEQHSENRRAA
jgi:undecaprenyl phosphate N,N'-diacetylbacillosamine 1-phosphate transferase